MSCCSSSGMAELLSESAAVSAASERTGRPSCSPVRVRVRVRVRVLGLGKGSG